MKRAGITITITILLSAFFYSCIFKKRNDWCSVQNLLKDTLLFENPDSTVFIDEKYCESYLDYAICIKGRIQNRNPLSENIKLLGITHVDSLNNEMEVSLGPLSGADSWFDPIALEKKHAFL